MISKLYDWLERRIDVFAPFDDKRTPPDTLTGFWAHYLRPVRSWMVVVLFSSLAIAALDAALYAGVGRFVDILATSAPDRLWAEHGNWLLGALALVLVARPLAPSTWV